MDGTRLVFSAAMADYDFGGAHPLKPVRVLLAVELMRAYGLLDRAPVLDPPSATDAELELVHDPAYVATVREAGEDPLFQPKMGLGTPDDPLFPGMHDAAALIAGASVLGMREVLGGSARRAFSVGGGLHHAHRDRAAGFCVYNDPAVAIAVGRAERPGVRVLYVDIDAHHGDGVQEAFYGTADVMTVSLHESGRYLFPGTGFEHETGTGEGVGYAVNVPMPPRAGDECYDLAFERVVRPLARAFAPDVVVGQFGCDGHRDDPLTSLGLTLPGYARQVAAVVALADELCGGRILACGGGGYDVHSVVPRAFTLVTAALLGETLPEEIPPSWRAHVAETTGATPPMRLTEDGGPVLDEKRAELVLDDVRATCDRVRELVFPSHGLTP